MNRQLIIDSIVLFAKNKNVSESKCIDFVTYFLNKIDLVCIHKKKNSLSNQEILVIYHLFFTSPQLNVDNKINIQDLSW